MSTSPAFDPARTAVLIMDYQAGILAGLGAEAEPLVTRAVRVLDASRTGGLPIFFVKVCFRPGHPEIGENNPMFATAKQAGRFASGSPDAEIHPAVAPRAGDVIVMKRRVSAFAGSDLELILRARKIDTLVLFGVATSGVVLSTVRQAADADYRLHLVADCCADRDPEVHRVLLEKIFPRQAEVADADTLVARLRAPAARA
ncbi:MAG TPA: isochorismatase family cysteine hydrolase [Opitutaceae bacterium]|nr:isochorismatase family cysteine hydrolase [Opitutaceae bacterium]